MQAPLPLPVEVGPLNPGDVQRVRDGAPVENTLLYTFLLGFAAQRLAVKFQHLTCTLSSLYCRSMIRTAGLKRQIDGDKSYNYTET